MKKETTKPRQTGAWYIWNVPAELRRWVRRYAEDHDMRVGDLLVKIVADYRERLKKDAT